MHTDDLFLDVEHFVVDAIDDPLDLGAVLFEFGPGGGLGTERLEIGLELVEPLQVGGDLLGARLQLLDRGEHEVAGGIVLFQQIGIAVS
jgi:hypothetical protein